jgi:hypothetical protein
VSLCRFRASLQLRVRGGDTELLWNNAKAFADSVSSAAQGCKRPRACILNTDGALTYPAAPCVRRGRCEVHQRRCKALSQEHPYQCAALTAKGDNPVHSAYVRAVLLQKHHDAVLADDDGGTECIFLEPDARAPSCVGPGAALWSARALPLRSLLSFAQGQVLRRHGRLTSCSPPDVTTLTPDSALAGTDLEWRRSPIRHTSGCVPSRSTQRL